MADAQTTLAVCFPRISKLHPEGNHHTPARGRQNTRTQIIVNPPIEIALVLYIVYAQFELISLGKRI